MRTLTGPALLTPEQFQRLPEQPPAGLSQLSLPGEVLGVPSLRRRLRKYSSRGVALVFHDIVAPELAQLIPVESGEVRLEFASLFRERCALAAELKAPIVTFDADLTRAEAEPEFAVALAELLRSCSGVLDSLRLSLRLPLRLPNFPGGVTDGFAAKFRTSLLSPWIGWELLVFPGEAADTMVSAAADARRLHCFRFYSDLWRIDGGVSGEEVAQLSAVAGDLASEPRRLFYVTGKESPEEIFSAFPLRTE